MGAGNSAGQAAVYLASQVAKVWLLVRGPDLEASMSRYLVDRIAGLSNVEVVTQTSVTGLEGRDGVLEAIRWRRGAWATEVRRPIRHLFLFIGRTRTRIGSSGSGVALDAKGFCVDRRRPADSDRRPLETSRRGVFAIGDVRSGSVKRVAAAVGEGAQVVAALHAPILAASDRRSPVVMANLLGGFARLMHSMTSRRDDTVPSASGATDDQDHLRDRRTRRRLGLPGRWGVLRDLSVPRHGRRAAERVSEGTSRPGQHDGHLVRRTRMVVGTMKCRQAMIDLRPTSRAEELSRR